MKIKVSVLKRKMANINFFNVNVFFFGDMVELSVSGVSWPFFLEAVEHSTANTHFHFSPLRKHLACSRPHHRLKFYFSLISLLCALCAFSLPTVLATWKTKPKSWSARCTFEPVLLGGFRILKSDFTYPASEPVLALKTLSQ